MGEVNSSFGRPVVIVNPSYLLKTFVIQKLLEMEYEVYYVESVRCVKSILQKFPNAMCLIDVDSVMAAEEYLNFIASIERRPEYSDVIVGVLTRRSSSLQKSYSEQLVLKAGFINTSANKETILETLTRLFNQFEIKGRRQFVRVSLRNESGAQFYCKIQGLPTHFPLRDISSCGFACEAAGGYPEAAFVVNSLIPGELQLGSSILPCSVVLYAIKNTGKSLMLVMLFAQTNAWSNKKTIREFVAETLQKAIEEIRSTSTPDDADYSKMDETLPAKPKTEADGNTGDGEAAAPAEESGTAGEGGDDVSAGGQPAETHADDAGSQDAASEAATDTPADEQAASSQS